MVVMIQVEFFWVVMPCSTMVGISTFHGEDGGNMDLRNVGILSQPGRAQHAYLNLYRRSYNLQAYRLFQLHFTEEMRLPV